MKMDELESTGVGGINARNLSPACTACGRGVDKGTFRIAINPELVDAVYGAIGDVYMAGLPAENAEPGDEVPHTAKSKMDARIDLPAWICSRCADAGSRCPSCGQPEAGMRPEFRWFIDDDGLVTCNPFVPDAYGKTPDGCINPACGLYSPGGGDVLRDLRRHAVGYQGFPDPYADILGDPGVRPGELRGKQ